MSQYSLTFWSLEEANAAKQNYTTRMEKLAVQKLETIIDERFNEIKSPLILGDFNDWKPEKMVEIFEFSETLEPHYD